MEHRQRKRLWRRQRHQSTTGTWIGTPLKKTQTQTSVVFSHRLRRFGLYLDWSTDTLRIKGKCPPARQFPPTSQLEKTQTLIDDRLLENSLVVVWFTTANHRRGDFKNAIGVEPLTIGEQKQEISPTNQKSTPDSSSFSLSLSLFTSYRNGAFQNLLIENRYKVLILTAL